MARQRSELALRESEERFRQVFESSNVGKSITLPSGEVDVNQAFCDMVGFTREELRNKTWQELTPDEDVGPVWDILNPMLQGEKSSDRFLKRYLHKNGLPIWTDVSVRLLRDHEGRPVHFLTTVIDISEQKKNEEARIAMERQYTELIEQAADGVFILGLDGSFVLVNTRVCEMLGYTRDELLSINILDTYPVELRSEGRKRLSDLQAGYQLRFERPMLRKDGSVFIIEASAAVSSEGLMQSIIHDITDRKMQERILRESEEKFKHVFESANVGKSITLPEGGIHVNKAFCDLLGYTQEELENTTWQELTCPDDLELTWDAISPLLHGEKDAVRFYKRYLHKNGSAVWVDISTIVQRNTDGVPMHFITTVVDITERKRMEDALRESEYFFKESQRAAFVGSYKFNFNTGFWSSSEILDRIFGIDAGYDRSIAGWLDLVHSDDREMMDRYFADEVDEHASFL